MTSTDKRARALSKHGTIAAAVASGDINQFEDLSVSEALVLGLYNQGVTQYLGVFGHGSTTIAETLRSYQEEGLVKTWNMRHETAAAHAATAIKILTGETTAVITSIGPGAMHAFAGSLCSASNGAGVYHIYGDETTHGEGFNMQQIPRDEQGLFLKMTSLMGEAYSLYEPWSIVTALRNGAVATGGRTFNSPFFLMAPMNIQPVVMKNFNLLELPPAARPESLVTADETVFSDATERIREGGRITIKLGQGARGCGPEVEELAELLDAAIVSGPNATGIVPAGNPRNMSVGGSKGSLSGNFAMNEADSVIVIGARAVCQWDSSGTAWKKARNIINFNSNPLHAAHYNRTVPVVGDAKVNLRKWIEHLKEQGLKPSKGDSPWYKEITGKREEWYDFRKKRYDNPRLHDEVWGREVLTQPAAIKIACDFADERGAVKLFDAGDVQANGFQVVEDEKEGQSFTDTGSSYMGFAVSALFYTALNDDYAVAFTGDGSFTMNPQIIIDAAEHGARGCVFLLDNRRMAAITGLQYDQYEKEFATSDSVEVDYVSMANSVRGVKGLWGGVTPDELRNALEEAFAHKGLSLIHLPVYSGRDPMGSLGVYGDWNVGNWCERVQEEHHRIGL